MRSGCVEWRTGGIHSVFEQWPHWGWSGPRMIRPRKGPTAIWRSPVRVRALRLGTLDTKALNPGLVGARSSWFFFLHSVVPAEFEIVFLPEFFELRELYMQHVCIVEKENWWSSVWIVQDPSFSCWFLHFVFYVRTMQWRVRLPQTWPCTQP